MAFEAAKCPNCGAPIQVPTEIEQAKCMYCGSTIIVKDAIQKFKVELSGSVIVDTNIESMMKSAEGFLALEKWDDAMKLYNKIVEQDSTDYRGWWGLFLTKTHNMKLYGIFNSTLDTNDANSAIKLAPQNVKQQFLDTYNRFEEIRKLKNYRLNIQRDILTGKYRNALINSAALDIIINSVKVVRLSCGDEFTLNAPDGVYNIEVCKYAGDDKIGGRRYFTFEMHNDVLLIFKVEFDPKADIWHQIKVDAIGTNLDYSEKYTF